MRCDRQTKAVMLNCPSAGRPATSSDCTAVLLTIFLVLLFSYAGMFLLRYPGDPTPARANADLTRANMRNLTSPLELYRQQVGAYPAALDDLHRLPPGMTQEAWGGPYVSNSNHLKDAWGQVFQYKAPGVKNVDRYEIWSVGADGASGTGDDICNW